MKNFKYDKLSESEKAILDEIEMINGVLSMAKSKGEVSNDFYLHFKSRLVKLLDLCKKRFDEVYLFSSGGK